MKCLPCFWFKRNRAKYSISSRKDSNADSNEIIPKVTSVPPLPSLPDTPIETNYESIIDSSVNRRRTTVNNEQRLSILSVERDDYGKTTSKRSSQTSYDDGIELYATVDKTREAKNSLKRKTDATNTNGITLLQNPLSTSRAPPLSQPILSSSSYSSESTKFSMPSHIYMSIPDDTTVNNHDNASSRPRPYYKTPIIAGSLPSHIQHSKIQEEKQTQLNSSVNNGREIRKTTDLHVQLSNDTISSAIYDSPPSRSYSQRSNESDKVNNTKEQSTTKHVFQEIDSVRF